jgi:hypothetical protein
MPESTPPPGSANISVREYIYFLPYPIPDGVKIPYTLGLPLDNPLKLPSTTSEPTSTLVLTSPNASFVDLRILKPLSPGEPELPNATGPNAKGNLKRLEWGFAGTSKSEPVHYQDENGELKVRENVTHSTWRHWVDSRHTVGSPDVPIDEGDMYALPDGRSLEHGHWNSPWDGRPQSYEEMWTDVSISSISDTGKVTCVVLRAEGVSKDGEGVRGVIIRLGQYCQGILKIGDRIAVERWEHQKKRDGALVMQEQDEETKDEKTVGNWTRVMRVGEWFLPCAVTFKSDLQLGNKVIAGEPGYNLEWVIEELVEWGP